MGIVSLLSTIIYVATFFTMFLAVFSYTAFKLRDGRRKKTKHAEEAETTEKHSRPVRVYLLDKVELVGTLKWYDEFGLRLTLVDGREVTVCRNTMLYYEELDQLDLFPVVEKELTTETKAEGREPRAEEQGASVGF
jgi:sRNA-binding regulator protein Hfq